MREFEEQGVTILGISFDSVDDNRKFAEKYDFPYRLLSDVDRSIGMAYGACETAQDQYPHRYTYVIGADGTIEQAIDTKDPKGQAEAILKSL